MTMMLASKAFYFEDNVDQAQSPSPVSAPATKPISKGKLGTVPICNKNGAGSATDRKGAVHRQIDEAQYAECKEYRDTRKGVTQPLPDRADIDIANRHEESHDERQNDRPQNETASSAHFARLRVWG